MRFSMNAHTISHTHIYTMIAYLNQKLYLLEIKCVGLMGFETSFLEKKGNPFIQHVFTRTHTNLFLRINNCYWIKTKTKISANCIEYRYLWWLFLLFFFFFLKIVYKQSIEHLFLFKEKKRLFHYLSLLLSIIWYFIFIVDPCKHRWWEMQRCGKFWIVHVFHIWNTSRYWL